LECKKPVFIGCQSIFPFLSQYKKLIFSVVFSPKFSLMELQLLLFKIKVLYSEMLNQQLFWGSTIKSFCKLDLQKEIVVVYFFLLLVHPKIYQRKFSSEHTSFFVKLLCINLTSLGIGTLYFL
jgi:hypothetical protein